MPDREAAASLKSQPRKQNGHARRSLQSSLQRDERSVRARHENDHAPDEAGRRPRPRFDRRDRSRRPSRRADAEATGGRESSLAPHRRRRGEPHRHDALQPRRGGRRTPIVSAGDPRGLLTDREAPSLFGSRPRRTRLGRALGVLAGAALTIAGLRTEARAAAPTTIDSVDSLFSVLARSPGFFAHFHEEKQIALLVLPLKSDGTIHFDRQHGLVRHTLSPQKRSVLLSGSTLSIWDGSKTETVSLQSSAPLRALAEA